MLVYNKTKKDFLEDVDTNNIENIILSELEKKGHSVGRSELNSWKNSLYEMDKVLYKSEVPDDAGVSVEYKIPQTSKRIDFILSGQNENKENNVVIIELKQWETANKTEKDAVVSTLINRGEREVSHPSYQAWSYAELIKSYNSSVEDCDIELTPCAYLHNYKNDNVIRNEFYNEYLEKAPVFIKEDKVKLRNFIEKHIKYGDTNNLMYKIENGKIRPSKTLSDKIGSMLKGNKEFVMIDEQKVVFEKAVSLSKIANSKTKQVLIVEGGPGTGKSVVAVNLLAKLTELGGVVSYVSKNAAPRDVYHSHLTSTFKQTVISNLFKGSGSFYATEKNTFDTLIVDEAHRLVEKSGLYGNLGENQVKEIINSSKFSIFFIDENQRVTLKDIGDVDLIENFAKELGAEIHKEVLPSQFRCNGSDGYLNWLDNTLQIKETANDSLDIDYDFRVLGSPTELRDLIIEKNKEQNKARLVAGYCWNWVSRKDSNLNDIEFEGTDFKMKWNLKSDGNLWILKSASVQEVGCIHTCQGLELDYVGVIIGDDLIVRNGEVLVDPTKRASTDRSIRGYRRIIETEEGKDILKKVIKNTYRTLMTRGIKGCYIYCTDKETREYFSSKLVK